MTSEFARPPRLKGYRGATVWVDVLLPSHYMRWVGVATEEHTGIAAKACPTWNAIAAIAACIAPTKDRAHVKVGGLPNEAGRAL